MSLVYGRDPLGKTVPLLVDANGAAIMAAVDAGGAYHVIKLDSTGHIIPVGVDVGGTYHELLTDASGRLIPVGLGVGGVYHPALMDDVGDLIVAGKDSLGNPYPLRTDTSGRQVVAGQDSLGNPYPVRVDTSGRLVVDGNDVSGNARTLRTDTSGRLIVAGQDSGGAARALRTEAAGRPETAMHHYTAAAWGKQPLIWGFSDAALQAHVYVTLAAGTYTFVGNTVPADEVWEMTTVSAVDVTTAVTSLQLNVYDGVNGCRFTQVLAPAAGVWLPWSGNVRLKTGWRIQATFVGVALGDTLNLRYAYTILTTNL